MDVLIHIEGQNYFKWGFDIEAITTANKIIYKDETYRVVERVYKMGGHPLELHVYLKK